jgi:hypothetical protein
MRVSERAIERYDTASAWLAHRQTIAVALPVEVLAALAGLPLLPTRRHSVATVTSIHDGRWPDLRRAFGTPGRIGLP